ncbi:DUF4358 domain-containing protein [Paenibacillus timonensis]|nr:DUF4358 domain-containing protein [Paenibacillus timonensis]MUG86173.1 DUF4358 domain-containing protein [Paenibacillus timonensis]
MRLNVWRGKRILAILTLVFAIGFLTGCTGKEGGNGNFSAVEVGERIQKSADLGNMKQGDAKRFKKLYHLSSEDVSSFVLYTASSNVKADELLVIRLKDESEKDHIMEKIEERIAAQTAKFMDYRPAEYDLVKKHVLKTQGLYILFAVSAEADVIERIFNDTFS